MKKVLDLSMALLLAVLCSSCIDIELPLKGMDSQSEQAKEEKIVIPTEEESEHLFFKGVPIDGSLEAYVAMMKQVGFKYQGEEDGIAYLKGDFAGFKNCMLAVATVQPLDLVAKIVVVFPEREDWGSLARDYGTLKSMLTEKYGKPARYVEDFQTYGEPDDDGERLHALKGDECTWYSVYEMPKGSIELSIENDGGVLGVCYVVLRYHDRLNTEAVKKQAMEDL